MQDSISCTNRVFSHDSLELFLVSALLVNTVAITLRTHELGKYRFNDWFLLVYGYEIWGTIPYENMIDCGGGSVSVCSGFGTGPEPKKKTALSGLSQSKPPDAHL